MKNKLKDNGSIRSHKIQLSVFEIGTAATGDRYVAEIIGCFCSLKASEMPIKTRRTDRYTVSHKKVTAPSIRLPIKAYRRNR
ncbi:hypothetical protein [Sphingobacterium sp. UBA5670]|uniref:hypothetical protein n=1 Tax=Sphingobacterium sp. UBA5670 TaxID=1947502 RepID=UPI0025DB93F6|nr:hypothetical protein [Sphingobacterium sp. UBA5670]